MQVGLAGRLGAPWAGGTPTDKQGSHLELLQRLHLGDLRGHCACRCAGAGCDTLTCAQRTSNQQVPRAPWHASCREAPAPRVYGRVARVPARRELLPFRGWFPAGGHTAVQRCRCWQPAWAAHSGCPQGLPAGGPGLACEVVVRQVKLPQAREARGEAGGDGAGQGAAVHVKLLRRGGGGCSCGAWRGVEAGAGTHRARRPAASQPAAAALPSTAACWRCGCRCCQIFPTRSEVKGHSSARGMGPSIK